MIENGIKLKGLRVREDYLNEGKFVAEVEFNLNGHKLELTLSQEQTRGVVEACASAIVKASAEAAEAMRASVNQALNLIESSPAQEGGGKK